VSSETETRVELVEQIPDEISARLTDALEAGDAIILSVSTDMRLDGSYATGWLIATAQRLITYNPTDTVAPTIVDVPLDQIESVEMRELVYGNNILKVRTADRGIEVARFTKTLAHKFRKVLSELRELVGRARPHDEALEVDGASRSHRGMERLRRCSKCGRVIPERRGICPFCIKKGRLVFRLLSYGLPYWRVSVAGLLLMLLATTIGLTPPLLTRTLIDDVLNVQPVAEQGVELVSGTGFIGRIKRFAPRGSRELLLLLVGLLFLITVSTNGIRAIRGYMMTWFGEKVTLDLRVQVYRHLHALSLSFFNQRETGRIMSRLTNDASRLQDFISEGLQEMIRSIFTIAVICVVLFTLNWQLAAFVLIPTPFLVVLTLFFGKKLHRVYHTLWKRMAGLSAILADTIPGIRVVKAFAQERREVRKFRGKNEELFRGTLKAAKLRTSFTPLMSFITYLGTIIIWMVGGSKVMGGAISLGSFVAFTGYMMRFYGPVESLCRLNHRLQHAATSAERLFEVLDTEPDVPDPVVAVDMPEIEGRVQFEDVTFSYSEGKPVLKDITFDVEPGEMIGLVGHSGAGKSTLINLICRFYDVDAGSILVDGIDIRDTTTVSLRNQIGVVLQEPFLFNGSVTENIVYGKPDATMREVLAAATAANAHDFITAYPDAYDTQIGERGVKVSGGERQRLAIARAILKDPRILILDEATSSVDTETEAQIQEALAALIRGRTTFAIAHRLSTLRHANRLFVIEKGPL
jgi:ATP-binding cassette, subfamily B, bacterial